MKKIATILAAAFVLGNVAFANSDDIPPSYKPSIRQIIVKQAHAYHIDPMPLYKVAQCESNLVPTAWNKSDPNGGSKGILQFNFSTFSHYADILNIKNKDIWSISQQIQVAAYMQSIGQLGQWSCAHKLHLV